MTRREETEALIMFAIMGIMMVLAVVSLLVFTTIRDNRQTERHYKKEVERHVGK